MDHPYEEGKTYRKRYGRPQPLSSNKPKMRIRCDYGRNQALDIPIQLLEASTIPQLL